MFCDGKSAKIPTTTSSSYGFDIIINNLSIGTTLQQLNSQNQSNGNTSVILLTLGYNFSNADELKLVK